MIARADKGNSIVILPTQQYESKTQDFLHNNFITTARDPTNTFHTEIKNTIKQRTLIPSDSKWKYINLNPSAPSIKGLIKLHKQGQPIRLVVNWRNAPAYQLSKLLTQKINIAPLPDTFNVKNTTDLLHKLQDTPMAPYFILASPDYHQLILKHPGKRNKNSSHRHTKIPPDWLTNPTRTLNVVWHYHETKLFHPQPRHNIPTWWPCNGSPFIWPDCRTLPTTHRKHTCSRPITQT